MVVALGLHYGSDGFGGGAGQYLEISLYHRRKRRRCLRAGLFAVRAADRHSLDDGRNLAREAQQAKPHPYDGALDQRSQCRSQLALPGLDGRGGGVF